MHPTRAENTHMRLVFYKNIFCVNIRDTNFQNQK